MVEQTSFRTTVEPFHSRFNYDSFGRCMEGKYAIYSAQVPPWRMLAYDSLPSNVPTAMK